MIKSPSTLFMERINHGLRRVTVSQCSRWAETYRVINGKPWGFSRHPWLRAMHDSTSDYQVGQKSAQMGFTEWALNRVFYNMDICKHSCLYLLPASNPDAGDFSSARFDPAIEASAHLRDMFSNVKNVGLKRAGSSSLYIRGSRSRSQLKSVPVSVIIFDEVDEMDQDNIPLAMERTSGQLTREYLMISTPTIEGYGINKFFETSTKSHFFFRCPSCSQLIELMFPESMIITGDDINDPGLADSHLICTSCKSTLNHSTKTEWLANGNWVPSHPDRAIDGFYINQLYSTTITPHDLAIAFLKANLYKANEQEFYNSKLGLTHFTEGARLTYDDIKKCIGSYRIVSSLDSTGFITMGVDVGKWLHYEINEWHLTDRKSVDINAVANCRLRACGKVTDFDDLDKLMHQYNIKQCVIDANPERRKSKEFANRHPGRVKICYYGRGVTKTNISTNQEAITVDRTSWLDQALGRFKDKTIILPVDIPPEYIQHIQAPAKIYEIRDDGTHVSKYVTDSSGDHYAHARNYAEIALKVAATSAAARNVQVNL